MGKLKENSRYKCFLHWLFCCFFISNLLACDKSNTHTEIRMALAQAPLNLDPRYATDAASERVNRLLYRPLVDFDEHARPKPVLTSWHVFSPTQYRFDLGKEGRQFHDGSY